MSVRDHFEALGGAILPPWLVPGPALPWLEGLPGLLPLDFMFAPVVVCEDVVD